MSFRSVSCYHLPPLLAPIQNVNAASTRTFISYYMEQCVDNEVSLISESFFIRCFVKPVHADTYSQEA